MKVSNIEIEEYSRRSSEPRKILPRCQKQVAHNLLGIEYYPYSSPNRQLKDELIQLNLDIPFPGSKQTVNTVKNGLDEAVGKGEGVIDGEGGKVKKYTMSTKEFVDQVHG